MKIGKWLDEHLEETIMVALLVIISIVSLLQVIIRKIPWIPSLTWAEEFCRFCWIWSVFISLPYTIRIQNMLRVSVLVDLLPGKARKVVNIIVDIIVMGSMALLAYHSWFLVGNIKASSELSPAMLWPMWIIYSMMLIGFALATIRSIQQIALKIIHFNERELTTLEQTMKDAAEEAEMAKGGNE